MGPAQDGGGRVEDEEEALSVDFARRVRPRSRDPAWGDEVGKNECSIFVKYLKSLVQNMAIVSDGFCTFWVHL